jgi:hypothetical protein
LKLGTNPNILFFQALEKALGAPKRPAKPYALFVGDLSQTKIMSSARVCVYRYLF